MKICFLQPRKSASLIGSDGPIAARSAKKFRLVSAFFVLLSLFPGVSAGQVSTSFELPSIGQSRLPYQITPGSPLSAAVVNQFPSHLSGGGSLRVFSVYSEGGYAYKVNKDWQVGLNLNYEYDDFAFTGLNFYAPHPWNTVHTFGGSFSVLYNLSDTWGVMVVPILDVAGTPRADWGRALIYGGAAAAIYHFGKDRSIGIGMGALNNLEQASIFPMVLVNWKFNEWLRLSTPYRASPAGPGGVELTYFPLKNNKDLRIGLGATYLSKRFRLDDTGTIANGIGEYDTIPVFARLSYRVLPVVDVNLYGGASLYNYLIVDDSRGGQLFHTHQNVAPFIGIGLSLNFEKFTREY
jgi:Domain of unknown function (DUF6268)